MSESTISCTPFLSPATSADQGPTARPLTGNTGAECTAPSVTVDWLSATFPDGMPLEDVEALFGGGWEPLKRGNHGYKAGKRLGSLKLWHDGGPKMGVHVEASGQACRELEASGVVTDWRSFLRLLDQHHARARRLDVAFDEYGGVLQLERMEQALAAGEVVTHFRCFEPRERKRVGGNGEGDGKTLYIGSPASESCIRVYDKKAEQLRKGNAAVAAEHERWTRLEWQTRNKHAEALMAALIAGGMQRAVNHLTSAVEFKQPSATDSNDRRWKRAGWWAEFVGQVERLNLGLGRRPEGLRQTVTWLSQSVSTSLGVLLDAARGDLEPIYRLLAIGKVRQKKHHRQLLKNTPYSEVLEVLEDVLGLRSSQRWALPA